MDEIYLLLRVPNYITVCFYGLTFDSFYCSVRTDLKHYGANSSLFVAKVNQSDSGNYTCSIGPNQGYTVMVHVLNGRFIESENLKYAFVGCVFNSKPTYLKLKKFIVLCCLWLSIALYFEHEKKLWLLKDKYDTWSQVVLNRFQQNKVAD